MADDDTLDPEDEVDDTADEDIAPVDVDPDELDEEGLAVEPDEFGGDEFTETAVEDEAEEDEEDEDTDGPARRSVPATEEEDDDDILAPDDVEADLDTILKDRLVAADDNGDDEEDEPEDRSEAADRLQPKRSDEQLCPSCFLLIRNSAPTCPIGDDECPILAAR